MASWCNGSGATPLPRHSFTSLHRYDACLLSWGYNAHSKSASLLASLVTGVGGGVFGTTEACRVLDTGCGTGLSGEALRSAGFGPAAGIDISSASLDFIRRTKPGVYDTLEVRRYATPAAPPQVVDLDVTRGRSAPSNEPCHAAPGD